MDFPETIAIVRIVLTSGGAFESYGTVKFTGALIHEADEQLQGPSVRSGVLVDTDTKDTVFRIRWDPDFAPSANDYLPGTLAIFRRDDGRYRVLEVQEIPREAGGRRMLELTASTGAGGQRIREGLGGIPAYTGELAWP